MVEAITNADGRTDAPLLECDAFTPGVHQIEFSVGAHFGDGGFLDRVPVRFTVIDSGEPPHDAATATRVRTYGGASNTIASESE